MVAQYKASEKPQTSRPAIYTLEALKLLEYNFVYMPVEIRDLTVLLHESQLVGDMGRAVRKNGQMKLRHRPTSRARETGIHLQLWQAYRIPSIRVRADRGYARRLHKLLIYNYIYQPRPPTSSA